MSAYKPRLYAKYMNSTQKINPGKNLYGRFYRSWHYFWALTLCARCFLKSVINPQTLITVPAAIQNAKLPLSLVISEVKLVKDACTRVQEVVDSKIVNACGVHSWRVYELNHSILGLPIQDDVSSSDLETNLNLEINPTAESCLSASVQFCWEETSKCGPM